VISSKNSLDPEEVVEKEVTEVKLQSPAESRRRRTRV